MLRIDIYVSTQSADSGRSRARLPHAGEGYRLSISDNRFDCSKRGFVMPPPSALSAHRSFVLSGFNVLKR
jgi:hypothetical protein